MGSLNAKRVPLKKSENILVFYQKTPVYNLQFTYGRLYTRFHSRNDTNSNYGKFEEELLNPSVALTTVSQITKSLRILQNHAQAGAPLSSIADIESDYRFIVSGNYISFYRAYGSEVFIDRILCPSRLYADFVRRQYDR